MNKRIKKLFRGANVIIDYPGQLYTNDEADICLETKYAQELSIIYFQLRDYFVKEIDYLNKYAFYGSLAENYNRLIKKNGDIKENLQTFLLTIKTALYFAYGSNMDKEQMKERCPGAIPVGIATLDNYKFVLDSAGTASIVPENGSKVEGLLWLINTNGEKALDRYEGTNLTTPCYIKKHLEIEFNNEKSKALVYVSNRNIIDKPIRKDYINRVVQAAKDVGLTKEYIRHSFDKYTS